MKNLFREGILALLPVLMFIACSDDEKPEPPPPAETAIEEIVKELESMSDVKDFTTALKEKASSLNIQEEKLTVLAAKDFGATVRSTDDKDIKRHILKEVYDFSAMTSDTLMVKTITGEELYVIKVDGKILVNGVPLTSTTKTQVGESVVYVISTAIPSTVKYVKPKYTIKFTVLECNEKWSAEDNRTTYPSEGTKIKLYREIEDEFVPVDSVVTDAQGKATYQHNYADGVYYTAAKGRRTHLYDGWLPKGVFATQEEADNSPEYRTGWVKIDNKKPGTLILADVNGDALINDEDKYPSEYMGVDADEEVEFYLAWEVVYEEMPEENIWSSLATFEKAIYLMDQQFSSFVCTSYIMDHRLISANVRFPELDNFNQAIELWGMGYKYIRSFHTINERINEADIDEAFRELWQENKCIAKFAYVYTTMVTYWGGMPLITRVMGVNDKYDIPRSTKEEVMVYIESMMQEAPAEQASVIRTLLARYYANEKDYQKACNLAEQVSNSNLYNLVENPRESLWNREVMLGSFEGGDDTEVFERGKYVQPVRYTEVILTLAESYAEMGELNKALQYYNIIRQRSHQPQQSAFTDQENARTLIRELWREEFAKEGLSYMFINRWGLLEATLGEKGAKSFNNLLPIPLSIMQECTSLIQNPGY